MADRLKTDSAHPCIWMSAGLLAYRLCDRDFECEQCPLDAALRGTSADASARPGVRPAHQHQTEMQFPNDRFYTTGHTWLRAVDGDQARYRLGLDGFAAAMIARPRNLSWNTVPKALGRGENATTIGFDGGSLQLHLPVDARLSGTNESLDENPGAVIEEPYEAGWLVELEDVNEGSLDDLMPADAARNQARLDLRRFRRRIALHLLAQASEVGPTLADGGELVADPWFILGGDRYLELLRELIH